MKKISIYHQWQLGIGLLAIGHQIIQHAYGVHIPFLHAYLDDILAMPLFLGIWHWERNLWWRSGLLRKREIASLTLVVFLLFEFALPAFSPAYTADWLDGLAYCGGSTLYWWIQGA